MMVKQNNIIDVLVVVRTGLVDSGRQRRRSTGKHAEDVYLYTQQITGSTGKHAENVYLYTQQITGPQVNTPKTSEFFLLVFAHFMYLSGLLK